MLVDSLRAIWCIKPMLKSKKAEWMYNYNQSSRGSIRQMPHVLASIVTTCCSDFSDWLAHFIMFACRVFGSRLGSIQVCLFLALSLATGLLVLNSPTNDSSIACCFRKLVRFVSHRAPPGLDTPSRAHGQNRQDQSTRPAHTLDWAIGRHQTWCHTLKKLRSFGHTDVPALIKEFNSLHS